MSRKKENTGFVCLHCGMKVDKCSNGSYRNHCPGCLYSLHVDDRPGDRANGCRGLMVPEGIIYNPHKGYQIIHKCQRCGVVSKNRIAESTRQPDNWEVVVSLTLYKYAR